MWGVACFIFIAKKFEILHPTRDDLRPRSAYLKQLVNISPPLGLQTSVNGLGSTAVAAVTTANKVNFMFNCGFDALTNTMANYAGQNMGAGRIDRFR